VVRRAASTTDTALGIALVFVAGVAVGCTSDSAGGSGEEHGGVISCQDDPRGLDYVANLERRGASMRFVLRSADPAPPAQGKNAWTLALFDGDGKPIIGAKVAASPSMPDHGHPSSVVPKVTDKGDGTYAIDLVYLIMPGLWQTTITASTASSEDKAVFDFCIGN
jgi:hypothetical protein